MSAVALTLSPDHAVQDHWTYTPQIGDETFFRWLESHCLGVNSLIVRLFG